MPSIPLANSTPAFAGRWDRKRPISPAEIFSSTVHGAFFLIFQKEWGVHSCAEPPPFHGKAAALSGGGFADKGKRNERSVKSYFLLSFFSSASWTEVTTILVRAKRAMALGMTMRLLNISVSSHTRSLLMTVPRNTNTSAMTE